MPKVLLVVVVAVAVAMAAFFRTGKPAPQPAPVPAASNYLDYTPEVYASSRDKRRILYFFATWCPTCSVANQDLTVNSSQIPADVVIFRTDYDKEIDLKRKYAVTYQHTFVQVDREGNELAKWNGGGLPELLRNLKK